MMSAAAPTAENGGATTCHNALGQTRSSGDVGSMSGLPESGHGGHGSERMAGNARAAMQDLDGRVGDVPAAHRA